MFAVALCVLLNVAVLLVVMMSRTSVREPFFVDRNAFNHSYNASFKAFPFVPPPPPKPQPRPLCPVCPDCPTCSVCPTRPTCPECPVVDKCPTNDVVAAEKSTESCVWGANHNVAAKNIGKAPCDVGGEAVVEKGHTDYQVMQGGTWIWKPLVQPNEPVGEGPLINFNNKFTVPAQTTVTVKLIVDDCADLFVNCNRVGRANLFNDDGTALGSILTFNNVALKAGCNIVQVLARNLGGPAALAFVMTDNKDGRVVLKSDKTWNWTMMTVG